MVLVGKKAPSFSAKAVVNGGEVVACSTDTPESHWGWLQVPKDKGGIKGITYPLVADQTKTITENYGILFGDYFVNENDELEADGPMIAFRGLFLIDKDGIVQHQIVNNLPLCRNVEDACTILKIISGSNWKDPFSVSEKVPDFSEEIKKYSYMWTEGGEYSKKNFSN